MWSHEDQVCSLRPPPSDTIFTVIVALLTLVMSIPITMLLTFVLEQYASKCPGKAVNELTITTTMCGDEPPSDGVIEGEQDKVSARRDSKPFRYSAPVKRVKPERFGEVIRGGIVTDNTTHSKIAKHATQFSYYNGKNDTSMIAPPSPFICPLKLRLFSTSIGYVFNAFSMSCLQSNIKRNFSTRSLLITHHR